MFNPLEHPIIFSSPKRRTSMLAWHEHFPFGMFLVGVLRPRLLVELGTHGGDSYCCFCQAVSEFGLETKCHAVDTWQGDEQAGYYGNDILNDLRAHHDPLYSGFSELIQSTFDDALSRFADGSIDLLHIDGLHTYEAVRHDFETWLPKVSERGVILFHDTNVMERDFGVWKFWEEVRHGYPNFEFKHGYGLGVLAKRDVDSEILRMFFEAERNDSPQVEMLRHLFHGIGQRFTLDDEKKVFGEWKDIMLKEKDALLKEKSDLIAELHRFQTIAADQHQQIAEQQGRISSYVATIADLQAQAINDAVIRSGVGYRALLKMRGAFTKAFPEASPQRAAFQQMRRLAKVAVRRSSLEASNGTVQELPAYTYEQWIEDQRPTAAELEQQRQTSAGFAYRPLISILTPLYNTPERVLREAIESVLNQTYDNLELCLADGASQNPEVREIVREYAARDSRIKFKFLSSNLGISGNSNAALSLAGGDFIAIFDHDDLLAPNALFEVVAKLNEAPDCDMVYFDEDKISEDGKQRHSPWFKPGAWSPEGLLNSNFLMHSIFRRSLVEEVGGFNPDTDGAQDWDLAFRCTERSQRLAHVPKVLYHWRQMPTSASHSIDAKPWAFQSQIRCVGDHLERLGIKGARVEFARVGELRVLLPNTGAKVSIIIPTKDKLEMLKPCVDSILYETDYADYEVLVVDTGSKNPETWKYYESLGGESRVRILQYSERFNFSAVNNYAARFATGELLLFLNNDTQALSRDWLTELAGWAQYPGIGVVGCKLTRPDNTIQHGGVIMGLGGHCSHLFDGLNDYTYTFFGATGAYRNLNAITGACLMMKREIFEAVGGFDEVYDLVYSDVEICLRTVARGYRVVCTPFANVLHHEGKTRGFSMPPADILRATIQMLPWVREGDSFFNPNLSTENVVPSCKPPMEETPLVRLERILQLFGLISPFHPGLELPQTADWPQVQALYQTTNNAAASAVRKLLLIGPDLSSDDASSALQKLAGHLRGAGYALTVLAAKDGPLRADYEADGIEVLIEPHLLLDVRYTVRLASGYDGVLVNTLKPWRAIIAARACGKPSIWWIHEAEEGRQEIRRTPLIAESLPAAGVVLFSSQAIADLYRDWLRNGCHQVIRYGLGLDASSSPTTPAPVSRSDANSLSANGSVRSYFAEAMERVIADACRGH